MKKILFLLAFNCCFIVVTICQPAIEWQRSLGGTGSDQAFHAQQTFDGGFIVTGYSNSDNGDVTGNHGNVDYWLVKLSKNGELQWQKSLGGSSNDWGYFVQQTDDGGYILAGSSSSNNGDVSGNHGSDDYWIVKMNPVGEIEWQKSLGGSSSESANCIRQTNDGGYIIAGNSFSNNGDVSGNHGANDFWIVKLNDTGDIQWQKSLGGSGNEFAYSIQQLSSGGYIVAGKSSSNDGDVSGNHGANDFWIVRLNENGDIQWQKSLGGSDDESANYIQQTNDDGFIVTGWSSSEDGDVSGHHGEGDCWVVKLTETGDIQWQKMLGGNGFDQGRSIYQTQDNGYIVGGGLGSNDVPGYQGGGDYWIVKLTEIGDVQWQKLVGGSAQDIGQFMQPTSDGGYILAGWSGSNDGDVSGNHGGADYWIAKLTFYTSAFSGKIHIDPENDCLPDVAESPLSGWLVRSRGIETYATLTDEDGFFFLPVDTGNYTLEVTPPIPYWEVCNNYISVTAQNDTTLFDFPISIVQDCPYLEVDISAPFLRRCFDNTYTVHYCNYGTATAEDAYVEVTLDPFMTYQSSTIPFSNQNGNTLTFDLGDVAVNECGDFQITAYLDCDSTVLGQTHCTEAHIFPDSLCIPTNAAWDGSSIEVDVECAGDSVVFIITNTGTGDMAQPLDYIIIEDQIVLMQGDFQLNSLQSTSVTFPANGATFHLEAQQSPEHPSGTASTGATIEGCGGWMSLGFFIQWPANGSNFFMDRDCQTNIGSFDPNDKTAFPEGFTEQHLIEPGTDIEYLLRFQNTGTDTAFKVVVVDMLPPELDLATVRPGASSHPYTYSISQDGWLVFTFENILLPDSTTNEPGSHGFVRFRVSQVAGLGWGDTIANTALIYFDFNAPILTNTTIHRIGQIFYWGLVDVPPVFLPENQIRILPNPLTDSALLQVDGIEPGNLRLVLTNTTGQVLREERTFGTGFEFRRGELASGVYFFKIEKDGRWVGSGKLMVR